MDASRALRAVTIFLFVGLAVRPAGAQFNFGGGCDFDLWPSGNTLTLPSCSKYPGRPGSETQTWDYICSQGNDCAESTNPLQEPFESRGSLHLTLAGACGSSVSDTYCPYQWDYVRQGELWFEASGRDGQLQTVPVPPFGVEFELVCALHSPTITSTSCTYTADTRVKNPSSSPWKINDTSSLTPAEESGSISLETANSSGSRGLHVTLMTLFSCSTETQTAL